MSEVLGVKHLKAEEEGFGYLAKLRSPLVPPWRSSFYSSEACA